MASSVAKLSPRHAKRFPVHVIASKKQFLAQLDREANLLEGVDTDFAKGIRDFHQTVKAIVEDCVCFKED